MNIKTFILGALICTNLRLAAQQPQPTQPAKPEASAQSAQSPSPFKNDLEKRSYAIGAQIGSGMKAQGVEIDPDIFLKAMKDVFSGSKLLLSEEEIHNTLNAYQAELRQKAEAAKKEETEKNKKAGDAFLAENKSKEGVITLASGLEYKVLKQGNGAKPKPDDTVVCNYRGTLLDGKEFDSSYKRGEPASFEVGRVIKGWTEALQLMPVGSKWQLFIPADLAYGDNPPPRSGIEPGSTLVFEVELLSIKEKTTPSSESKTPPAAEQKPAPAAPKK